MRATLYGSQVRGDAGEGSDWDILLISPNRQSRYEQARDRCSAGSDSRAIRPTYLCRVNKRSPITTYLVGSIIPFHSKKSSPHRSSGQRHPSTLHHIDIHCRHIKQCPATYLPQRRQFSLNHRRIPRYTLRLSRRTTGPRLCHGAPEREHENPLHHPAMYRGGTPLPSPSSIPQTHAVSGIASKRLWLTPSSVKPPHLYPTHRTPQTMNNRRCALRQNDGVLTSQTPLSPQSLPDAPPPSTDKVVEGLMLGG